MKDNSIPYTTVLKLLKRSGLKGNKPVLKLIPARDDMPALNERIQKIIGIVNQSKHEHMLYFIMYDIEDNKIRGYISKYLEKKGCVRIQKSIFLSSSNRKTFDEIKETLKEINEVYDNNDSIVMVPVSADELRSMKIIGHDIDISLFIDNPNTLIF